MSRIHAVRKYLEIRSSIELTYTVVFLLMLFINKLKIDMDRYQSTFYHTFVALETNITDGS
jgi:hypothetical protein